MPALTSVLAVAGLIGGGVSAWGQYNQGQQAKQAGEINAGINEGEASIATANAGLIRQNAILNEYRQRKALKQTTGTQVAGYAKAGVAFTGSPLDVIADSISNSELEIAISKANSETDARNKEAEASGKLTEARLRRLYGKSAESNANMQAYSTLLQSGVQAGSSLSKEKWNTPKTYTQGKWAG